MDLFQPDLTPEDVPVELLDYFQDVVMWIHAEADETVNEIQPCGSIEWEDGYDDSW